MIEQLFGSKTRVKLLQLFYSNPNRSFYVREITRRIDEQINSVRRELSNLLSIGIISSETNNNKLYYEVNQKFEYYLPLAQIFGGVAVGAVVQAGEETPDQVPAELKALGHVEIALMTGQITRDERSGVDFMVVGDINQTQLNKFVADLEQKEGKELRFVSMTTKEFEYRKKINDRFLSKVLESKKQVLFDRSAVAPLAQAEEETKEPAKKPSKTTKKG